MSEQLFLEHIQHLRNKQIISDLLFAWPWFLFIIEILFYRFNIIMKCGINIFKKEYYVKNNIFNENIGNKYTLQVTLFEIKTRNYCIISSNREGFLMNRITPNIYGYIKYLDDKIIIRLKKPFSMVLIILNLIRHIIMDIKFIIYDIYIISIGSILAILWIILFNKIQIKGMKEDIEDFVNKEIRKSNFA